MANSINWFEISVSDIDRATQFYSFILGGELQQMEMLGIKMAFLPMDGQGVGGHCAGEIVTNQQWMVQKSI
jgi:uncharacterized protein